DPAIDGGPARFGWVRASSGKEVGEDDVGIASHGRLLPPRSQGRKRGAGACARGRAGGADWRRMHEELGSRRKRRQGAYVGPEAPAYQHESAHQWRHGQKIGIKALESIQGLFHRLLAPGEKVCAAECAHAEQGMAPEIVKKYPDSLDARLAILKERLRSTSHGQVYEDSSTSGAPSADGAMHSDLLRRGE